MGSFQEQGGLSVHSNYFGDSRSFQQVTVGIKHAKCGACDNQVELTELGGQLVSQYQDGDTHYCSAHCLGHRMSEVEVSRRMKSIDKMVKHPNYFLESAGVASCHHHARLSNVQHDFTVMRPFILGEEKVGLITGANSGVGKSHLAVALMYNWMASTGHIGCMKTVSEVHWEMKKGYDRGRDVVSEMMESKFLVIDDLGSEKPTEAVKGVLYDVINYFTSSYKPLLVTTNLSVGEIVSIYGQRIYSRISQGCIITVDGKDMRRE